MLPRAGYDLKNPHELNVAALCVIELIPLRASISATSNSACAISRARSKVMRRGCNDASIRSICSKGEENPLIASPSTVYSSSPIPHHLQTLARAIID